MTYAVTLLFCLLLAPILGHFRRKTPAGLFFAAAAVYAVFGAFSFAQIQLARHQVREFEPAYHDTFYVISHVHFLSIAMAVLGVITWVQTRFGAMRYSALTKLLFWILHFALIASTSFQGVLDFILSKTRGFSDHLELMETYALINAWSGFLSQTALLGLLCLLLWSIAANWLFGYFSTYEKAVRWNRRRERPLCPALPTLASRRMLHQDIDDRFGVAGSQY